MNDETRIAVIIACYNRVDCTRQCIETLMRETRTLNAVSVTFYVWDDASTDGTADVIAELSGDIKLFQGPGDYYWSKSMYYALKEAVKSNYDFYLMVNDDVKFYPNAVEIMLDNYSKMGGKCGIVGSTQFEGGFTYGGRDNKYNPIYPGDNIQKCYYANWNCFLIDRYVIDRIGLINPKYKHGSGDYDYSCRMNHNNMPQYVADRYVGECENDHYWGYFDKSLSIIKRLNILFSPKGWPLSDCFRLHWVDKRFKGLIIAVYSYFVMLVKVIIPFQL